MSKFILLIAVIQRGWGWGGAVALFGLAEKRFDYIPHYRCEEG